MLGHIIADDSGIGGTGVSPAGGCGGLFGPIIDQGSTNLLIVNHA